MAAQHTFVMVTSGSDPMTLSRFKPRSEFYGFRLRDDREISFALENSAIKRSRARSDAESLDYQHRLNVLSIPTLVKRLCGLQGPGILAIL